MGTVVLVARLILAGVFAVAAVTKLLDLQGSRSALRGFGVPDRAVSVGAVLLPLAELATAVAVVPQPSARWGALAALILFLAFIGGITNALVRGRAPECHCFGQLHSAPAGRWTLIRNAVLAIPAIVVVLEGPGPTIDEWVGARTGAELVAVAAGTVAVLLVALTTRLWRENRTQARWLGELRNQLAAFPPGLPVGAEAPNFSLADVRGGKVTLDALLARGRPVALMFVSPTCGGCEKVFADLGRWQAALAEHLTIALVSIGSASQNLAVVRDSGADVLDVLIQEESEVSQAYRVLATPATVVVSAEGRIASAPVGGPVTIEALLRLTLRRQVMSRPRDRAAAPQPVA